jgi:hypothetical protein
VTGVAGRLGNVTHARAVPSNSPDSTANVAIDINKYFRFISQISFEKRTGLAANNRSFGLDIFLDTYCDPRVNYGQTPVCVRVLQK